MTKYEVVKPLQYLHLAYVLLNLWERGRQELEGYGLTPETAFSVFANYRNNGPSGALLADGVPVSFTGTVIENDRCFTWFQATEAFSEHIEEISRVLIDEAASIPNEPLYIYSQCIHPKTAKWFRLLGFDRDEWQGKTPSGRDLYRFRRRQCVSSLAVA